MIKTVFYLSIVTFLSIQLACSSHKMGLSNSIDAAMLAKEYEIDAQKFNKKYKSHYITVTGQVAQFYKNRYHENIIILMDKEKRLGVKCILNSSAQKMSKPLKQGEAIKINGLYEGFEEFVILKGCLILKN